LLDIFWTMLIFFMWVIWLWILITVLMDVSPRPPPTERGTPIVA
jgi:hypothetical protein